MNVLSDVRQTENLYYNINTHERKLSMKHKITGYNTIILWFLSVLITFIQVMIVFFLHFPALYD